jgi:hypothetical protein
MDSVLLVSSYFPSCSQALPAVPSDTRKKSIVTSADLHKQHQAIHNMNYRKEEKNKDKKKGRKNKRKVKKQETTQSSI